MTTTRPKTIAAVLNNDGGTFKSTDLAPFCRHLENAFLAHGHTLEIHAVPGARILDALHKAAEDDSVDAIVCGGGDGTVSAGAGVAWRSGKVLGVLPAGTMNLFARSLGVPLDLHEAADALAAGTGRTVDIATANGRPFIHQYSVGVQSRVVKERSKMSYRGRIEKMLASLRSALGAVAAPPSFSAQADVDAVKESGPFSFIAVSNNLYGAGHLPYADDPAAGALGIYWAGVLPAGDNLQIAADLMRGTWNDNPNLHEASAREITIRFPKRRRRDRATIDGELIALDKTVKLRTHPGELKVIAPSTDQ